MSVVIEDKGYKDKKIQKSFALKCAIVAGLGLLIIYPIVIVLILLGLVRDCIPSGCSGIYSGAVYSTFIFSLLDMIASSLKVTSLHGVLSQIPLYKLGFGWFVPALLFGIIGYFLTRKKLSVQKNEVKIDSNL